MVDQPSLTSVPDKVIPNGQDSPTNASSKSNTCFTCIPRYMHPRVWTPDPSTRSTKKTLVLCFDGTGNSFDEDNSNVIKFISMLKKDKDNEQLVYYQAGIGTYTSPVLKAPIVAGVSKVLDEMVAWSLDSHVKDGYRFLMQNYTEGSTICIFGFSRGAFTARALAGMIQKVGLLPIWNIEQLPFAWTMYTRDDNEGFKLSKAFKRTFSIEVTVKFLGVWDTVQSVGLIPHHLPFSGSNNAIVYFRHAIALDERRVKFQPFYCTLGKSKNDDVKKEEQEVRQAIERSGSVGTNETKINASNADTDILEVFFAGAHCDVGGGSVKSDVRHSLARIPLRWMIRECFRTDTGIIFDEHMLQHEVGLNIKDLCKASPPRLEPDDSKHLQPAALGIPKLTFTKVVWATTRMPFDWTVTKTRNLTLRLRSTQHDSDEENGRISKGEQNEELEDALCHIYDQLSMHVSWKILECIPMIVKKQRAEIEGSDDFWAYKLIWNLGAGREVYEPVMARGMKVHRSVKTRIEALGINGKGKKYVPKIRLFIDGKPRRLTAEEWLAEKPKHFEWVD